MNDPVQSIAPRGPHGGLARPRPGQTISDDELIGSWQLFRKATVTVDGRLVAALTRGEHQPAVVYEAMAKLAASPHRALPMSELAATIGVSTGGLTKVVDRMVQAGFVRRHHSTTDRRIVYAVLTAKGAAHEQRSTPAYAEELRSEFERLGPKRLRDLRAICQHLEDDVVDTPPCGAGRASRG